MLGEIARVFNEVVASHVWNALLVDFVILLYYTYVRRGQTSELFRVIPFVIAVLFARDVASAFVASDSILVIGDTLVVSAYLRWLELASGRRPNRVVYGLVLLFLLVVVANLLLHVLPPIWPRLYRMFLLAYVGLLAARLSAVSEFNTPKAKLILATRGAITGVFVAYNLVLLIFGRGSAFVAVFVVPLASMLHLYMMSRDSLIQEEATKEQIAFLNQSRESLFDFLQKVGRTINERADVEGVLSYIVSSAVESTDSDAGAILLVDEFEQSLHVRAMTGTFPPPYPIGDMVKVRMSNMLDYFRNTPIPIGEGVLGEPAKSGEPLYLRDVATDPRLVQNTRDDVQFISSLIVIPLVVEKRVLGVLAILKRKRGRLFERTDFEKVQTFADYTSLTMDNLFTYLEVLDKREIEREVGIAAEIQQKLLPKRLPTVPNTSLAVFARPARGVSGDYYDILRYKDGRIGLAICDVAGKGVPASLVMVMIRSILHLIASSAKNAATVVSWINRGIAGNVELDHYATLSYLLYDPRTSEVEYSNAGHHPLLIYRREGARIETVDTPGIPIGIESTTKYEQKVCRLEDGDFLLLYTDGIVEAMDVEGRQYGYDGLVEAVQRLADLPPGEFSQKLQEELQGFVGQARQHDDQTMLVLKVGS